MSEVNFYKQRENAILPAKSTKFAAGYDLFACLDNVSMVIQQHETMVIPCGINVFMHDENLAMLILSRSGLACKGISVANSPGLVDSDFCIQNRDEICVILTNKSKKPFTITHGMKIAQAIFLELPKINIIEITDKEKWPERESDRTGGFGSTGL